MLSLDLSGIGRAIVTAMAGAFLLVLALILVASVLPAVVELRRQKREERRRDAVDRWERLARDAAEEAPRRAGRRSA